jgi:phytoene dehydrogenase-like protein
LFSVLGGPNKALDFARTILTSAEDLLNEWFETEIVKAPLARLASELGAPPSQKNLALGAMMMAMRHHPGMARPRGGTGALTQALVNVVRDRGGVILTDQQVKQVLVDDGRAVGVRVAGGKEYIHGTGWTDEIKNKVADRILDKLAEYAPNLKQATIARQVESPAELGERLGAYNGNYYHVDMTLEQMVFFRPLPEIANYQTPIDGLYLTGAGTHPGGSVSGMPGRNCAHIFINSQKSMVKALSDTWKSLQNKTKEIF